MERRSWIIKFFVVSVVIGGLALLVSWRIAHQPDPWGGRPHPRVVVTVPPLACFVRNVAGPKVALACLCTETTPGSYRATDADIALIGRGELLLGSGLGVDDVLVDALHARTPNVAFRKLSEDLPAGLESQGDPRVWLGLSRAVVLVERVRDELKKVDPDRQAEYDNNAERYIAQLRELESKWKKEVEKKKDRSIVSLDGPLRHFADSFALNLVASYQLDGKESAGSKTLQEVVKVCVAENGPRVLTAAPGFEHGTAAKALGKAMLEHKVQAALVVFDPLETADASDLGKEGWYVKMMHDNLERVVKHLR